MIVQLSKESKNAYNIFGYLRNNLPNANPATLRHVSVYLARCYQDFDICSDLQITFKNNLELMCKLLLSDGRIISFSNCENDPLNIVVKKTSDDIDMTLFINQVKLENSEKIYASGIIIHDDWKYIIDSLNDDENCYIKVYYKEKLLEDATSYFFASDENDIGLDCFDNLGYLTSIMMHVELLYNNIRSLEENKLVRKK